MSPHRCLAPALVLAATLPGCASPTPGPSSLPLVVSDRGGAVRVFEIDPAAGTARLLGSARADDPSYADTMPVRLADGRVAFVSDRGGRRSIYLSSRKTGAAVPLFAPPDPPGEDSDPAPLGSGQIVFARAAARRDDPLSPPPARDLYVAGLDGAGVRALTRDAADDGAPCAAPDGRTIVFVSDRDGARRLYRIDSAAADPESTIVRLLPPAATTEPADVADTAPACLPDGSVLFARRANGRPPQIVLFAPAAGGSTLRQITEPTTLPAGASEPVSLPDRSVLLTAGPARRADGRPEYAVYRISEGGYDLARLTRAQAGYNDFSRRLEPGR